jgi:hypothetical protein
MSFRKLRRRRARAARKDKEDEMDKSEKSRRRRPVILDDDSSSSEEPEIENTRPTKRKKPTKEKEDEPKKPKLDVNPDHIKDLSSFLDLYNYEFDLAINKKAFEKLKEPLTKLNNMIGMNKLKQEVLDMVIYYLVKLPNEFTIAMDRKRRHARGETINDMELDDEEDDSFIVQDGEDEEDGEYQEENGDLTPAQEREMRGYVRDLVWASFMGPMARRPDAPGWMKEDMQGLSGIKPEEQKVIKDVEENLDMLHTILCGPPGCGKSTVAVIIGEIYSALGFLDPEKEMKKVGHSDFTAGYLGQTEEKTKELLEESLGGVLFLDEAYSLGSAGTGNADDYGRVAADTITGYLTQHKQIFEQMAGQAGYSFPEPVPEDWFKAKMDYFPNFGGSMETLLSKVKIVQGRRAIFLSRENQNGISIADLDAGFEVYKKHSDYEQREAERNILHKLYV